MAESTDSKVTMTFLNDITVLENKSFLGVKDSHIDLSNYSVSDYEDIKTFMLNPSDKSVFVLKHRDLIQEISNNVELTVSKIFPFYEMPIFSDESVVADYEAIKNSTEISLSIAATGTINFRIEDMDETGGRFMVDKYYEFSDISINHKDEFIKIIANDLTIIVFPINNHHTVTFSYEDYGHSWFE